MNAPVKAARQPDPWSVHVRAMLRLGLPLVGMHLAQLAITTTDTIMLGWLGATELAAGVLGAQAVFLLLMLGSGFSHALMPIIAQAEARGRHGELRRHFRMGLWLAIGFSTVCMLPLWYMEQLLLLLSQEPDVAALAGRYCRIMQWSLYPSLLLMMFRSYLVALERPQVLLWNTVAMALLNGLFNYALIFGNWGMPAWGVEGAAIASVAATGIGFGVILAYSMLERGLVRYFVFSGLLRPDWRAMRELALLGWPIGLTIIAEVGLFAAAAVLVGWIGTVPLAAHGIAMQLVSITFMVPLGLSGAATVRIGQAVGHDDPGNLRRASITAVAMGLAAGFVAALLFWLVPGFLVSLFLDEHNPSASLVLGYAITLLSVAAAFQVLDSLQVTAVGLLRGLKDTRTPMLIAVVSYWVVGLPAAYFFGFFARLGGPGVWIGLACGLTFAAVLLMRRFLQLVRLRTGAARK